MRVGFDLRPRGALLRERRARRTVAKRKRNEAGTDSAGLTCPHFAARRNLKRMG